MRRVVVTGIGMCTPLGFGWKHCWNKLIEGKSGINSYQVSKLVIYLQKLVGSFRWRETKAFSENIIEVKDRKK